MAPVTMLIKPASSLCNMRCKYCFYADVAENRAVESYGLMSLETLENLVRKAFACADGFCSFAFQGGEPTLAGLDFYRKLIELQKKYNGRNIQVFNSIQTNGYKIDEEFAEFLAANNFLVGLSVDGTRRIHDKFRVDATQTGTFDVVQKTAELFDKHRVEYNILCVVNNLVASNATEVYASLKKYKYLQFIPCLDGFDGVKNEYSLNVDSYAEFLKRTFDKYYSDFIHGRYVSVRNFDNYISMILGKPPENCAMNGICTCYFVVEGDGSVFPCDFYVLDKWRLGNINENSFAAMMKSPVAHEFVESSRYTDPACCECKWYKICRGGCRRDREPFVDKRPSLNKYCAAYGDFFEYAYDRMREIAERIMSSANS